MGYKIKDLEKLSGIKAHTIRIWEKRYNMFTPARTESKVRLYSDAELVHLLNVCILYNNGYKISHIALMDKDAMNNEQQIFFKEIRVNTIILSLIFNIFFIRFS